MKHSLPFFLLFIGLGVSLSAQDTTRSARLFNLGLSVGFPQQVAYPTENSSGFYLVNAPLLYPQTVNLALSGNWIRAGGWGYGLEAGYRLFYMGISDSKGQRFWGGNYRGNIKYQSVYLAPQTLYNLIHDDAQMWNLSAGAEVHVSFGARRYTYGQNDYYADPASGFVLLRLGTEYLIHLNHDFNMGLYVNFTQGLDGISTLNVAEENGFEVNTLGEYRGTGFDFGLRFMLCWECREK